MTEFMVTWSMPIEAESAEDAALQAAAIVSDPANIATVFSVEEEDGTHHIIDTEGGEARWIQTRL